MRTAWERLSLYLPVILMGVLALSTYWLVRSTPLQMAPTQDAPARHEPDYFMRKFSVKSFDRAGRLTNEVTGADARHFPDTDTLEIDSVLIRSFNEEGHPTVATANRALTNGDASEVQLFGKALIVREALLDRTGKQLPRIEYRGEYLHAFMDTERVSSNQPVELRRGSDVFFADTMEFDNVQQVMNLRGRVKGTLAPPPAK